MALRSLRLERFGTIRRAEVTFERTTVLIGEIGAGVAGVIDALNIALSSSDGERPRIEPRHFHPDAGDLRIGLTFGESAAGSWNRAELSVLAPILSRRDAKARTLVLEIVAARPDDAHWVIRSPGGASLRDDVEALAAVRRINPFVCLRHAFAGPDSEDGAVVEEGTQDLLGEWMPGLAAPAAPMRAVVTEILEEGAEADAKPRSRTAPRRNVSASAAQELGVLRVAGQLAHELRRSGLPGVQPILVIQEPEAHLHPMTLASVWQMLEQFPAQKIITTQSGTLLGAAPLRAVRRLVRDAEGNVRERRVPREALGKDDLRKVAYHLRARRSVACFARVWLLVEGETEFWILPDLARLCGYDLAQEGIACVEYAQCGLVPLIRLADCLGIEWHVLTDGDEAGGRYAATLQPFVRAGGAASRLTRLADHDIEHTFWRNGHASVFARLAGMRGRDHSPRSVIRKAIESCSKPGVAFELLAAVAARGPAGVPRPLRIAIESSVRLARGK